MARQQVLTSNEVDNMQWERPTQAKMFCAQITKSINALQQIDNRSLRVSSIEMLQLP